MSGKRVALIAALTSLYFSSGPALAQAPAKEPVASVAKPGAVATINDFPEAPGRQYVQQICLQCHEPAFLLPQHRSEPDWKRTVTRMSRKGLGGPQENYDAVAAYMSKYFGPDDDATKININRATVDELVAKLGFTKDEAAALVSYREKNGDFREWGDMLVIFGVDGHKIKAAKDKLSY
jgi:competence protein ComEA